MTYSSRIQAALAAVGRPPLTAKQVEKLSKELGIR